MDDIKTDKISPEFAARLASLGAQHKLRAIVMLHPQTTSQESTRRLTRAERQAVIKTMRQAIAPTLDEIDRLLVQHDGKRLAQTVSAVGTIPIETTPAGVYALAALTCVKAILEDQRITLLSDP